MSILERLDATIQTAAETGALIESFDLTEPDYADLMVFAAEFDAEALDAMRLDMINQTYKGYPLRPDRQAIGSTVHLEDGDESLAAGGGPEDHAS